VDETTISGKSAPYNRKPVAIAILAVGFREPVHCLIAAMICAVINGRHGSQVAFILVTVPRLSEEVQMSQKTYKVLKDAKSRALIDDETYQKWYKQSVKDPEKFWAKHGKRIDWFKPYTKVKNTSFTGKVSIKWFEDGVTNVSYNCIDRHLKKRGDQVAIIWEGDNPYDDKKITYRTLRPGLPARQCDEIERRQEGRPGHHLHADDSRKRPMRCWPARGSAPSIRSCSADFRRMRWPAGSSTANQLRDHRRRRPARRQEGSAQAQYRPRHRDRRAQCVTVKKVLVVQRTAGKIEWFDDRDIWYHEATAAAKPDCPPAKMKAEDPLFILYTSGSTGKPKGVLHTTGGYLVYASMTHEYVFDYHEGDIYWCTADVGWVTGHSYIVYGPLANGATTLMFEGVPNLSVAEPFLGCGRQAQGQHLLHRADGDPGADGRGRRACEEDLAQVAAHARVGRRADQPGSLGMVLQCRRREAVPDRRHLVADRDRRHPDHAAARRDRRSSPVRRHGRSSACSRSWSTMMADVLEGTRPRAICASPIPGRARCARSMATTSASSDLFLDLQGQVLHR
jgi:hypothetical protein